MCACVPVAESLHAERPCHRNRFLDHGHQGDCPGSDRAPEAEARGAIPLAQPRPRYFEQDPEDWWRSTSLALRELTAKVEPARVAGLEVSNQRETFGLFGEHGEPIRPAIVWLDERAIDQVCRFGAGFGAEKIHAIPGKPIDITPCVYRMVWLRENEPHLLDRAAYIADVHGYLCFRLTGRWTTLTASADPLGVLDTERLVWSDDTLAAAGVPIDKMLGVGATRRVNRNHRASAHSLCGRLQRSERWHRMEHGLELVE